MSRSAPYDREKSIQAALDLFWDKGYHATSLKDLEKTLSMKPGSIYAAFKSKENLYLLTLEHYYRTMRATIARDIHGAATPLTGLIDFMQSFVSKPAPEAHQNICMMVKTLSDTRHTDPKIAALAQNYMDETLKDFERAFLNAMKTGEIPETSDYRLLARRYQAHLNALRLEQHRGAPEADIKELSESFVAELTQLRA